ncbi:MAG: hypothetical protein ACRBDL_06740 [Alphaproteobacteria bacterium]
MSFFDLPPTDERKASYSFLTIGQYPLKKWIKDPDYYICYRTGRDMRIMAIAFGLVSFLFSIAIDNYEFRYFDETKLLDIYAFFIILSGPLMTASLIYYYMLFEKYKNFDEYDFVRWNKIKATQYDKNIYMFCALFSLLIGLFPNSIRYFFYSTKFDGYFHQFFDDPLFVLFVASLTAFFHSVFLKGFFMSILTIEYLNHEKTTNKLRSK